MKQSRLRDISETEIKRIVTERLSKENPHFINEDYTNEELASMVNSLFFMDIDVIIPPEDEQKIFEMYMLRKEIAYQTIRALLKDSETVPQGGVIKDERDWKRYFHLE